MMYQYIFFDLDGTLTDSKEGILNCLRYAFEKLGDPVPPETELIKFIGPPLQDSFMGFCGYSREKAIRAVELFRERYAPLANLKTPPRREWRSCSGVCRSGAMCWRCPPPSRRRCAVPSVKSSVFPDP